MQNPYLKKRGDSPPPKNSFQRELNQKMRERAKKGLAADVSPHISDDEVENNELFGDFNATLKPKGSGYLRNDSRGDSLMLTMKKPWQPPASWRKSSPPLSTQKGQKLGSMGEEEEEEDELDDSDDEPKKARPSFLRSHSPKEQIKQQRPKSPSIYGRKQSMKEFDELDSVPDHSSKNPHRWSPSAGDAAIEERRLSSGRNTPKLPKSPVPRKSIDDNLSNKSVSSRNTPTDSRKSPSNDRRTPSEDSRLSKLMGDHRKTPTKNPKSPVSFDERRELPNEGHRSHKLFDENRKTPTEGLKSPRTVGNVNKSPGLFENRRTPTDERKSPGPPHQLKKKSSVLDFLDESSSVKKYGDDDDDDEHRKVELGKTKHSSTPELHSVKVATIPKSYEQQNSEDNVIKQLSDGESSVCEEKLGEPVRPMVIRSATTNKEKAKIKMVKIQRAAKTETDEAIEVIEEAQNGTQKMKYIDPVKNEDFKTSRIRPASGKILKPRAIYSSSGTLSRTSGSSNEALNFDSAQDIRQTVYEAWKMQATDRMKQSVKEKKQKQIDLEEKQKKDKEEKALESKATYNAWMDKKKGFVSTKVIQAKREEKVKKKEEEKKKEKQKEAQELFIKWKESKDVSLKEKHREKIRAEKREERLKEDKKNDKIKEAESAFKKWNQNKEEFLKSRKKDEVRTIKQQKEEEERQRLEQERTAKDLYEKWLEKKEKQEIAAMRKEQYDSDEEDTRRPWRPSSTKIHHIR